MTSHSLQASSHSLQAPFVSGAPGPPGSYRRVPRLAEIFLLAAFPVRGSETLPCAFSQPWPRDDRRGASRNA